MKRNLAMLTAVFVGGVTAATTAAAHDSFAISIGAPGFGVGYATGAVAVVAPPVVVPPAVYVYPAPIVYGPRFVAYGPYWRQRYWRR